MWQRRRGPQLRPAVAKPHLPDISSSRDAEGEESGYVRINVDLYLIPSIGVSLYMHLSILLHRSVAILLNVPLRWFS